MKYRRHLLLVVALAVGHAAAAQEAEESHRAETVAIAEELATLNATLAEIKEALGQLAEAERLGLVVSRVELSSSQADEIGKQLSAAESERTAIEDKIAQLEARHENFLASAGSAEISTEQLQALTAQRDTEVARLDRRRRDLDEEIAVLRNRLGAKERDLEEWQAYVDRQLGGL